MLVLLLALSTVRAELVEAPSFLIPAQEKSGPSTSSGRTGERRRAEPLTVIEAERAFAADAQSLGQWTAFRKWAAEDAVMFAPQPVFTQTFLKDRKDPPRAIAWSPTATWLSCDGRTAVNTGEWRGPGGGAGYFTTVWRRGGDGEWRWLVDGGDGLTSPRAAVASPPVRRAACGGTDGSAALRERPDRGSGASDDGTLRWRWQVAPDGGRTFRAKLWNGRSFDVVVEDRIAAPTPPKP